MALDRFENYSNKLKNLILRFESMHFEQREEYFDSDEMEYILDFYMETGDVVMLEETLKYSEKLFPDLPSIQLRKAQLCGALGRLDEAMKILKDLENAEPDNCDVLFTMAVMYSQLGEHELSIYYYNKASEDGNDLGLIYENMSMEYQYLGDFEQALKYSKMALKKKPGNEDSLVSISLSYKMLGKDEEHVEFLKEYVQENPYIEMVWFHLGLAYIGVEMYDKALQSLDYALAINDKMPLAYIAKANAYERMERYSDAVSVLNEMLSFAEGKEAIFAMIGKNYFKMKNYEVAAVYFKKSTQIDPCFVDAWIQVANCYLEMNDRNSALEYLSRGLEKNPKSQDMIIEAARVYMRMGDKETVNELFERLKKYGYEDDERTWLSFIELYIEYEEYGTALYLSGMAKHYVEDPFEFNLRSLLCYYRMDFKDVAYANLRDYVLTYPDYPYGTILTLCPEMADDLNIVDILNSNKM